MRITTEDKRSESQEERDEIEVELTGRRKKSQVEMESKEGRKDRPKIVVAALCDPAKKNVWGREQEWRGEQNAGPEPRDRMKIIQNG